MKGWARVRLGSPEDLGPLAALRHSLWPESSIQEHAGELTAILLGKPPAVMPMVVLVAEEDGELIGFLEAGLRSCADSCDATHPVGYVEGWYVRDDRRRKGIGALLLSAAQDWARAQGCVEMASDAAMDNIASQRAHEALGFEETGRSVNYRKRL